MLGLLRAAVAWREREAQRINIPRQRLIKDESLLEIAATAPATPERARPHPRRHPRLLPRARPAPGCSPRCRKPPRCPTTPCPRRPARATAPALAGARLAAASVLLAAKCEQHNVAPKLLASSEELDRLATEDEPDIPVLQGWRREVFGEDALALKAGRITLGVDGKRIKLVRS